MKKEKQLIIDRFEGDWAVIEYGEITFDVPKELLPANAKAGDVLVLKIAVDETTTESRKEAIDELFNRLRKKKD